MRRRARALRAFSSFRQACLLSAPAGAVQPPAPSTHQAASPLGAALSDELLRRRGPLCARASRVLAVASRTALSASASAQVFPDAAVLGPWLPQDGFDWMAEEFTFELDGRVVQRGRATQQMTAPEPALEYIRSVFPVVPGDVVMTGAGTARTLARSRARRHPCTCSCESCMRCVAMSAEASRLHDVVDLTHAPRRSHASGRLLTSSRRAGTPAGVGPVQPGQQGVLRWGSHLHYTVDFV